MQSVPAKLTRLGLSQVVNSLLGLGKHTTSSGWQLLTVLKQTRRLCALITDPAQPFDFLILGELLRQPLEKFLLAQSVSTV